MSDFRYAVDYQSIDAEDSLGPWEQDGRFETLEEAVAYATAEALVTTNLNHRVVKILTETITTLPPMGDK